MGDLDRRKASLVCRIQSGGFDWVTGSFGAPTSTLGGFRVGYDRTSFRGCLPRLHHARILHLQPFRFMRAFYRSLSNLLVAQAVEYFRHRLQF